MPTNSSCTECRGKRLRCDRKQPCSRCVDKGKAHLCQREARKPRGGERPVFVARQPSADPQASSSSRSSSSALVCRTEERRLQASTSRDRWPDLATCEELLYIFERRVYTLVGACMDLDHVKACVKNPSLKESNRDDRTLCMAVVSGCSL